MNAERSLHLIHKLHATLIGHEAVKRELLVAQSDTALGVAKHDAPSSRGNGCDIECLGVTSNGGNGYLNGVEWRAGSADCSSSAV